MSGSLDVRSLVTRTQKISDWFMLGVHLGVPNEELNKIDQRFSASHGVERCKAELFDLWLRLTPSARWDDVASALEQLNEMALASELRKLCLVSSPIQSCLAAPQPSERLSRNLDETVKVEFSKSVVGQFETLENKFASLVCNVKTTTVNKAILPEKLHSFLEARLNQDLEICSSATISDIFKSIAPYYCFLNTTLLKSIIDEILGEPALQQQLVEYQSLLENFASSTEISRLKEIDLKTAAQHKGMPLVVLKLSGRCLDVTIKRFQELVRYIFGKQSSALSNILVEDGCICITWNTRESAVPSLIDTANEKIEFIKLFCVLRLKVAEVTIFEQQDTEEDWENDDTRLEDCLVQSVISGCTDAVKFVLEAGADPNHQNANGWSVLSIACVNGSAPERILVILDIVKSLLEAGAQVNWQSSSGWTSLAIACEYGCYKLAELLIQYGADAQLSTFDRYTPLMIACHYRHEDIAALLLRSTVDPNLRNFKNQTSLMLACRKQLEKTVSLLLSSGADPNLQSTMGWTALIYSFASLEFNECIPILLISAGADSNIKSKDGYTALMLATRYGHVSGVKILLNAQAHVNAQDNHGNTALHRSALIGNLPITKVLLLAGADPSLANSNGKTSVDVALDSGHHEICQLLLSHSTAKSMETTALQQSDPQVPSRDTTSSSSVSTTPHHELDQLRFALRHPLPPAGTTKHDVEDIDDNEECLSSYHNK